MRGAVVSEAPPGFVPRRWCFPARNRIIAGLASATIVVQAAVRSGSLITAELAMDLGRDVGAVPGSPLDWRSAGANALLRDGATVVRDAVDALDLALGVGHGLGTDAEARTAGLDPALRRAPAAGGGGRDVDRRRRPHAGGGRCGARRASPSSSCWGWFGAGQAGPIRPRRRGAIRRGRP